MFSRDHKRLFERTFTGIMDNKINVILQSMLESNEAMAIDTPGGNLSLKIKSRAQQI
jgi:hypothetical protein